MRDMDIKRRALLFARLAMLGCLAATILATLSAFHGRWFLWTVNGGLFLVLASLALVNYRLAKRFT